MLDVQNLKEKDRIKGQLLVAEKHLQTTKDGKPFMDRLFWSTGLPGDRERASTEGWFDYRKKLDRPLDHREPVVSAVRKLQTGPGM